MSEFLKKFTSTHFDIKKNFCLYGIEREALRIDENNQLSLKSHPQKLGSPLCHAIITTDFSESQIEYTTTPKESLRMVCKEMEEICHYIRLHLEGEFLWPLSMPPKLGLQENIPIAFYGTSKLGIRKHIYRSGLANRYGSKMQTISGIHFNFSFQQTFWDHYFELTKKENTKENRNESYLSIIRNFLRLTFIFPYLFGDSPACDTSLLTNEIQTQNNILEFDPTSRYEHLKKWKKNNSTLYGKYSTALRQSEIGYNHPNQWDVHINYNSLEMYLNSMWHALTKNVEKYENFSTFPAGDQQLTKYKLQLENEHYAPIRPKQSNIPIHERPLTSLEKYGIEYLEIRCMDILSSSCCGVDEEDLTFIKLILFYCLFMDSPYMSPQEEFVCKENYLKVVWEGRAKNTQIKFEEKMMPVKNFGLELCDTLEGLAEFLDSQSLEENKIHIQSLNKQKEKFKYIDSLPSSIFLDKMLGFEEGYNQLGYELGMKYQRASHNYNFTPNQKKEIDRLCSLSIERQKEVEANNPTPFPLELKPKCC